MSENGHTTFMDEVAALPACDKINECIQCGVCSGSCSTATHWEYPPRKVIAMVRSGMKDELLKSNSIWFCVSCYLCTARCPRDIKPANIVHGLESIALKEGYKPPTTTTTMYKTFAGSIMDYGRIYEFGFMFKYFLKTNPFAALKMLPMAIGLFTHGRMPLTAKKVKGKKDLNIIIDKLSAGGGR
jgi:quinone-modifying oxidoreductase, subunit QmoC